MNLTPLPFRTGVYTRPGAIHGVAFKATYHVLRRSVGGLDS